MENDSNIIFAKVKDLDPMVLIIYKNYLSCSQNNVIFTINELFDIFYLHIEKLLDEDILKTILSIFHYTLIRNIQSDDFSNKIISSFNDLNKKNYCDKKLQNVIFELLHQCLVTLSSFDEFLSNIIPKFNIININSESKELRLRSRKCLDLMLNVFPNINLLEDININQSYFVENYTHFISILLKTYKIYETEKFWLTCYWNLLNENRKFAIYWLKKAIEEIESSVPDNFVVKNFFIWNLSESNEIINSWNLFLTILESLDGKQSHLILPTLIKLNYNKIFGIWIQFIAYEIMKHNNVLVLKWGAKFILTTFKCDDFEIMDQYTKSEHKSLTIILRGFNNPSLYTGSDSLIYKSFISFINTNPKKFFATFVNVDWKSIPLLIFMDSFQEILKNKTDDLSTFQSLKNEVICLNKFQINIDEMLRLAEKIRRIENKNFRFKIRSTFCSIFDGNIKNLELENYFKLLKYLFNENEEKTDYEAMMLNEKLKQFKTINFQIALESLKTLLILSSQYDECVNEKLLNYLKSNINLENTLHLLTYTSSTFKDSLIKTLEYNNSEMKTQFLKTYIKMFSNDLKYCVETIKDAYNLMMNDFNNIGKNESENNINYSILKQQFVDLLVTLLFNLYEEKLLKVSKKNDVSYLINEYHKTDDSIQIDLDIELFVSKGSFEVVYQFLEKVNLSKLFLCSDLSTKEKKLNVDLFDRILNEILTNSKNFRLLHLKKSFIKLFECVASEFPEILLRIFENEKISSDYIYSIFTVLLDPLKTHTILNNFYISESGLQFLVKGVLYGEPLLGEPRIEFEHMIKNELIASMITSLKIRLRSIELIEMLIHNLYCTETILSLRNKLLNESEILNKKKSRYFKNSKQHRLKLRLTQTIAIVCESAKLSREAEWTEQYLKSIFEENNQTDVTYIMEFLIAKSIPRSKLIELLKSSSNLNNSGIISLFVISYMFCYNFVNKNEVEAIKEMVNLILPWTMGQNFHIRLYAQITIYHLIKYFELKDFGIISNSLLESLKQGNSEKNFKKLHYDFRFNSPNLKDLLQKHIIYYGIPYLTQTDIDEWYDEELKLDYCDKFEGFYEEVVVKQCEDFVLNEIENVQRKINPIVFDEIKFNSFSTETGTNKNSDSDMIVIASLIEKLPNLGGIARSCEVLGIKKLALNSLKYIETKEFKGLSMTAEKWLSLFELKTANLQNYLIEMKSNGYEIIGAEQTTNSENFIYFKFPKKSILILGHEKEGIPANLIAFLDKAVEIPQFGVVRSLNVHVTGALFMWEYCKQHIAKN